MLRPVSKHVEQAVDAELLRTALEHSPDGSRLPQHDFSKPSNDDYGVDSVNSDQVRRRSGAPACADVYAGYVPIERLQPVLAEETAADVQCECLGCGLVSDQEDFGFGSCCPSCSSTDVVAATSPYDWSNFEPTATYPAVEVRITPKGDIDLVDGNHRVSYWKRIGFTHAPSWVVDLRPCKRARSSRGAR